MRELQQRNHKRKGHAAGDGLLAMRARGPSEEDFFEILSKFKLAFNLLAKLKGKRSAGGSRPSPTRASCAILT